ncbi:uncharacterized protein STEHIDRAFT_101846 [Stereum hirsutum FP-91666 SS1]|uniref:uncharacterized protein n=1 Tax=Stereum hirsutum (strain FP-91666) TaxID=721885 RepID=UPI0004449E3D|nr:uncharacterized protein STEHIDRAFT_101846 [Stereum hirsutum FP-91666 SS1]EIM83558.1 hypothetical protein STEHIDRAFT_101846 [Stereum hirsutum FP-91666 SS1]
MATLTTNSYSRPTAPTSNLPPLNRLSTTTCAQVQAALYNLRALYFPPSTPQPPSSSLVVDSPLTLHKRSARKRKLTHVDEVPDSGYASAVEEEDEEDEETVAPGDGQKLDMLRCDALERNFAIKWLTGFAARADVFLSSAPSASSPSSPCDSQDTDDTRAALIDDAASLLSSFMHPLTSSEEDEPEPPITRSFSFPFEPSSSLSKSSAPPTIDVELNDAPLLNSDHTSVGLQSWASCIVLAERMSARPSIFLPKPTSLKGSQRLRVLEIGAGTGLLSIVTAKILSRSSSYVPKPTIVATDYHPDVLDNLHRNVNTNFASSSSPSSPDTADLSPIFVSKLDWETPELDCAPLNEPFDIIFGADVVYHPSHAQWIRNCVERLLLPPIQTPSPSDTLSYPSGNTIQVQGGVFWLIVALRATGRHEGDADTVTQAFPPLAVLEEESVGRLEGGVGRADEGGYKLFKIGWVPVRSLQQGL